MSERVDALYGFAALGAWRGHDIHFKVKAGTFYSESAGIRDAKTLAEIKRLIDKQARKKYRPINALLVGGRYGMKYKIAPHTLLAPASSTWRSEPQVWASESGSGGRQKLELASFCLDTPANRAKIEEAMSAHKQAEEWEKKSQKIIESIPRCTDMPEEIDPGEED